ncbi:MAG: chaperone NapD [Chromatiaceae bacterium]|nr:chaperone NapD [Lamprobacter modestohalophilus]MCF8004583.1 chaperone NapD [Chromatiaceae bacterium]
MQEDMAGDILSCVVYAHPGQGSDVAARISRQPGAEVVAGVAESKLVVTLEDTVDSKAADVMAGLNAVPGVISTLLIYHCAAEALSAAPDHAPAVTQAASPTALQASAFSTSPRALHAEASAAQRTASPAPLPVFSEDSQ